MKSYEIYIRPGTTYKNGEKKRENRGARLAMRLESLKKKAVSTASTKKTRVRSRGSP